MESINAQVDLYLTEVSIELLGNKMYDINGKRQNKLLDLFKAVKEDREDEKDENSIDILCKLGYDSNFSHSGESMFHFLDDQMNFILSDANNSVNVNKKIIKNLRKLKSDQDQLLKDASEMHVRKLIGRWK